MILPMRQQTPSHLRDSNTLQLPLTNYRATLKHKKSKDILSEIESPSNAFSSSFSTSLVSLKSLKSSSNTANTNSINLPDYSRRNSDDEYLNFIDPLPVQPPDYSNLPPGGCPKFAILPRLDEGSEELPNYKPSIYKIAYLSRKLEWLSPYEPSPLRQWKNLIIEINSTQLNIYHSSNDKLNWFFPRPDVNLSHTMNEYSKNNKSLLTKERDLQLLKFCDDLGITNPKNLIRSYSLQHAKIGAAHDYKKKKHVLRIRAETEQFLISFKNNEDMIDWNNALCCARDLSLDLGDRELPKYRTVPRRRRRRRRAQSDSNLTNISSNLTRSFFNRRGSASNLSAMDSINSKSSIKTTFSKLKLKFKNKNIIDNNESLMENFNENDNDNSDDQTEYEQDNFSGPTQSEVVSSLDIETPNETDDDHFINDEEVHDIRDIHDSDDEEEDDEIDEINENEHEHEEDHDLIIEDTSNNNQEEFYGLKPLVSYTGDFKWRPIYDKLPSKKKIIRDSLRCINPLPSDEQWAGKNLVKPSTISQGNLLYMKNFYNLNFNDLKSSKLNTLPKNILFNFKDNLPDTCLSRLPNHFVKEYNVGPHGLIPKLF